MRKALTQSAHVWDKDELGGDWAGGVRLGRRVTGHALGSMRCPWQAERSLPVCRVLGAFLSVPLHHDVPPHLRPRAGADLQGVDL